MRASLHTKQRYCYRSMHIELFTHLYLFVECESQALSHILHPVLASIQRKDPYRLKGKIDDMVATISIRNIDGILVYTAL